MLLDALNARKASEVGAELASRIFREFEPGANIRAKNEDKRRAVQSLLQLADREVRPLKFNLYKKSKFANSFKWKLIESGCDSEVADELTQVMLVHLSVNKGDAASAQKSS